MDIVRRAFAEHFELGGRMLEVLSAVVLSVKSADLKVSLPVSIAALSLMSKTLKLLRAVHLLCRHSLTDEAAPLVRSKIEILAHAQFLSRGDKERNACRMLAWDAISGALHQERPLPPDTPGIAVERRYDVARNFRREAQRWVSSDEARELERLAKNFRQWTGVRITNMVESLSSWGASGEVWRGLYAALSNAAHGADIRRHITCSRQGYTGKLQPQYAFAGVMVSHGNDLVLAIAETLSSVAPVFSDVSLAPIREMKNRWDKLAFLDGDNINLVDADMARIGAMPVLRQQNGV